MQASRLRAATSLVLPLFALGTLSAGAGCTVTLGDQDAGPLPDASVPSGPEGGAPDSATTSPEASTPVALGFVPSNVPAGPFPAVGDVTVTTADATIDTGAMMASGLGATSSGAPYAFTTATQSDGSQVAVLWVNSLTVQQGAHLTVKGTLPLAVVASTTVNVQGTLDTGTPGNAGGPIVTMAGAGGGPGGGANGNSQGAGGGGYCGVGGQGAVANEAGAGASGGRSYGNATITPLLAGSAGGNHGGYADGGEGGGAIQISAGKSILVGTGGIINVPGIGGGNLNGGAGGSGGALLLEAPTVTVDGILAANGGGGGVGSPNSGGSGASGQPSAQPAAPGDAQQGSGGAGKVIDGGPGLWSGETGSGGGAVGRIRINSTSGAATIGPSAIVSPDLTTACATQGTLAH